MTGRTSRWSTHEAEGWLHSTQTSLLLQDFNLHVVPHRDDGDAYELAIQGESSSQVKRALSLWNQGRGADSFVSAVASTLLTDRGAWLEVIVKPDDRDGLPFRPLLVQGVRRSPTGTLFQEVPVFEPSEYPTQEESELQFQKIELDEERMIHVTLPHKYPKELLWKIATDLVEVAANDNLMPSWVMEQMTGQRNNAPAFDSGEAERTYRLRILQATLPIGWTAREIYYGANRHLGEYYYYWRELQFLHFRSSMRESAEKALQQVLTVAGERCGFEAHVTARGLYTPVEVGEIIKKYEAGDLPFSAATDIIFESANKTDHSERLLF